MKYVNCSSGCHPHACLFAPVASGAGTVRLAGRLALERRVARCGPVRPRPWPQPDGGRVCAGLERCAVECGWRHVLLALLRKRRKPQTLDISPVGQLRLAVYLERGGASGIDASAVAEPAGPAPLVPRGCACCRARRCGRRCWCCAWQMPQGGARMCWCSAAAAAPPSARWPWRAGPSRRGMGKNKCGANTELLAAGQLYIHTGAHAA